VSSRAPKKILVVDDEPSVTGSMEVILSEAGFEVLTANSFAGATAILKQTSIDLVITDLRLSDATGIDLTKHIKKDTPEIEVILMTGYGSLDITIEAIKAGAYYYLEKPYTPDRLFPLVDRALQLAELRHENESLKRRSSSDGPDANRPPHIVNDFPPPGAAPGFSPRWRSASGHAAAVRRDG